MGKKLLLNLTLPLLLLAVGKVHAESDTFPISPFSAHYVLDWKGGLSLSGNTVRELQKTPDNQWRFRSSASAMFASINEDSLFSWQNSQLSPLKYGFKRSVLGKKRIVDIDFDWSKQLATNKVENKPWQMPISPGVQDKLSYQLLLQLEIATGKTDFSFDVADGGHLKNYRFRVEGKEQVKTPIGEYEAIRVVRVREKESSRKTLIWFAPELNHQIIKLQQVEKKDKSYTLLLKSLKTQ